MKQVINFILGFLEFAIIVYAVAIVGIVFLKNEYGYTSIAGNTLILIDDENITELTHYTSGDLLIVKDITYNDVKVGDELYYYDTYNDQYIIRIGTVKTKSGDNRSSLYTFKETGNLSIAGERILGIYNTSISGMGGVISFLTSTVGFLLFVILPILVLFIYHIYQLIMILKYDKE